MARESYVVRAYPTTFLIDRKGKILHRDVGFASTLAAEKERRIREAIDAKD